MDMSVQVRDSLDAGQGSALCAYMQSISSAVLSVCFCLRQFKTTLVRHHRRDKQRRSLISPCCQTRASSSASHAPVLPPPPPCPRLLLSLLSFSPLFQLLYSATTTTTTTPTARRCLYPLVHASFDVANGPSYFHNQLRAALIHSFILTQHLRAGHLTHHIHQHQPYPHSLDALRY